MDRLEALVRDTLIEHADAAPVTVGAQTRGRRRTWWAVAAAVVAVLALTTGLIAAQSGRGGEPSAHPGAQHTGPGTKATAAATSDRAAGLPPGYKVVSYHGIEISVPKSLTVTHSPCAPPINAVYAPNGAAYSCPERGPERGRGYGHNTLPAGATAVWLDQTPDADISKTHEPTGRRTVTDVEVTVTAPTRAGVQAILASIRPVTIDHLGCPAHPVSITPTGQPADAQLAPRGARSAVVCELAPLGKKGDYWLIGSQPLRQTNVAPLIAVLDALPTGGSTSDTFAPNYDWIQFHYASGLTHVVAIPSNYAPAHVSDGHRTATDNNPGIDLTPLLPQQ